MLTHYDTRLNDEYERAEEYRDALERAGFTICVRCTEPFTMLHEGGGDLCPRCEAKVECIHCGDQFTPPYPGCMVCGECDRAEAEAARRYEWQTRQYGECEEAER